MEKKFKLSDDKVALGVIAGLAEYVGLDANLLRIGFFVVTLLTAIIPLSLIYLGTYLWLLITTDDDDDTTYYDYGIKFEDKQKDDDEID